MSSDEDLSADDELARAVELSMKEKSYVTKPKGSQVSQPRVLSRPPTKPSTRQQPAPSASSMSKPSRPPPISVARASKEPPEPVLMDKEYKPAPKLPSQMSRPVPTSRPKPPKPIVNPSVRQSSPTRYSYGYSQGADYDAEKAAQITSQANLDEEAELAAAIEASLISRSPPKSPRSPRSASPIRSHRKMESIDEEYERAMESSGHSRQMDNRRRMLTALEGINDHYRDLLQAFSEEASLRDEGISFDDSSLVKINQDIEYQMGLIEDTRRNIAQMLTTSMSPSALSRPAQSCPINKSFGKPDGISRPESPSRKLPIVNPGTLHSRGNKLVFVNEESSAQSRPVSPIQSKRLSPKQILVQFHLPDGRIEERVLDRNELLDGYITEFSKMVKDRLVIDHSGLGPFKATTGKVSDVTPLDSNEAHVWLVSRVSRMKSAF